MKQRHKWINDRAGGTCRKCGLRYRLITRRSKLATVASLTRTTSVEEYLVDNRWIEMINPPPCKFELPTEERLAA